jgi:predicted ester cyclase
MSLPDLKTMMNRIVEEAWNNGELDVVDEAFDKDLVYHDSLMPDILGLEGYRKYLHEVRAGYPDFHVTIVELVQEGNTLAGRYVWEGTQMGASPALKVHATGKKVRVNAAFITHFARGKIFEHWNIQDGLGFMRQLELTPKT